MAFISYRRRYHRHLFMADFLVRFGSWLVAYLPLPRAAALYARFRAFARCAALPRALHLCRGAYAHRANATRWLPLAAPLAHRTTRTRVNAHALPTRALPAPFPPATLPLRTARACAPPPPPARTPHCVRAALHVRAARHRRARTTLLAAARHHAHATRPTLPLAARIHYITLPHTTALPRRARAHARRFLYHAARARTHTHTAPTPTPTLFCLVFNMGLLRLYTCSCTFCLLPTFLHCPLFYRLWLV